MKREPVTCFTLSLVSLLASNNSIYLFYFKKGINTSENMLFLGHFLLKIFGYLEKKCYLCNVIRLD